MKIELDIYEIAHIVSCMRISQDYDLELMLRLKKYLDEWKPNDTDLDQYKCDTNLDKNQDI